MGVPDGSTWRCGCGNGKSNRVTSYADALRELREHQATMGCVRDRTDRIHSRREENEQRVAVEVETPRELFGPPRPPPAFKRRAREGLAWLPISGSQRR